MIRVAINSGSQSAMARLINTLVANEWKQSRRVAVTMSAGRQMRKHDCLFLPLLSAHLIARVGKGHTKCAISQLMLVAHAVRGVFGHSEIIWEMRALFHDGHRRQMSEGELWRAGFSRMNMHENQKYATARG
jgi:hypothetical protein